MDRKIRSSTAAGCLFVCLSVVLAACGGGGGGGGGTSTTTALVSGTILDSGNQPIAGATVTIASDPVSTTTDAAGFFSATVELGLHSMTVEKDGYVIYSNPSLEVTDGSAPMGSIPPTNPYFATPVTWYLDADGDGYSTGDTLTQSSKPMDHSLLEDLAGTVDCDDSAAGINPGVADVPGNDVDENCSGYVVCFEDADSDGYGGNTSAESSFIAEGSVALIAGACGSSDADGWDDTGTDCDDSAAGINPGAADSPGNDLDENCSGYVACYGDADADGYGGVASAESPFLAQGGVALVAGACGSSDADAWDDTGTDCDDSAAGINPGATDTPGNDTDENCSGYVACYQDADADGYGGSASAESPFIAQGGVALTAGACGSSDVDVWDDTGTDCDDGNDLSNPGAEEICDGEDNDCDEIADEGNLTRSCYTGPEETRGVGICQDGFQECVNGGYSICQQEVTPQQEVCDAQDLDEDCDGLAEDDDPSVSGRIVYYPDQDMDGYGFNDPYPSCSQPAGYRPISALAGTGDCDDGLASVYPGSEEKCNNVDDDCDGQVDDGATGTMVECDSGLPGVCGESVNDGVVLCLEGNFSCVTLLASDETCDGLDNDCDGLTDDEDADVTGQATWYRDMDEDGFGAEALLACYQQAGYLTTSGDCDDSNPLVNPQAIEVCDSTDNDCDGQVDDDDSSLEAQVWYADADSDSFGDASDLIPACAQPQGRVADSTDCDDQNDLVNPQSIWYADADQDGYSDMVQVGPSCERPTGHALSGELVSTIVHDLDDAFATTGVTGKALVSLYDADPAEVVLVDLGTGYRHDSAATPEIPWPAEAVGLPSGREAFLLSYSDRKAVGLSLASDTVIPAPNSALDFDTAAFGYMQPFTGAYEGGLLGIVSDSSDFLIWDPLQQATFYTAIGNAFWDVTSTSAGGPVFFATADYSANKLFILSDSAAVVDSVLYSDPARAIPSTADGPNAVVFSPDGARLYTVNYNSDDLLIFAFDAASGATSFFQRVELYDPTDNITADIYNSNGMVVSPDGGTVWIASDHSGGLVAYDTASGTVDHVALDTFGTFPVPGHISMTFDGRFVLLPGSNLFQEGDHNLYIVDTATHRPVLTIDTADLTTGDPSMPLRPVSFVPY